MKGKVYLLESTQGNFKLRIIYSNGFSQYQFVSSEGHVFYGKNGELSCFNRYGNTQKDTIRAAAKYDAERFWTSTYLGEL
jgi:hypothetical protein